MSALPDLRFHQWLWKDGDVRELRALGKFNRSGYFDTPEGLAMTAAQITADPTIQGVYVSLNPVMPDLLGRSARRVKQAKKGETTTDDQITERRIMLVDCDPVRPSGINSTEEQHLLALEMADKIRLDFLEQAWPEPAMVDTGNGAALWYAIELPTKDDALVHTCLQALAYRYDTEQIKIDLKVANAARIARLPGTLNRKGDNLPDRPQRRCRYLTVPAQRTPVPTNLLQALAGTLPTKQAANADGADWLDSWVLRHGHKLGLHGPDPWKQDGRIWLMDVCPWNPDHTDGSSYLAQHGHGAICAGCHHNSCSQRDWRALRDLVEPGWDRKDYPQTELGNAQMLVDRYGHHLRYIQEEKPHWLVYDGRVWSYDGCKAGHLANLIAQERLDQAESKEQQTWAYKSQSSAVRNGTLSQAATLPGVSIKPDDLDRDPWLLNFRNGTLDLRSTQLRPHQPTDHLTRYLDMDYSPDAPCELWVKFLDRIMGGNQEMVDFLQRSLGYSLTGSTQEQKIFLLHGHGANGKSTLLETWMELMGDYARKADTETFLQGKKPGIREDLLDLQGARLVAVTEINEGRRLDEAMVKEFSGGDRISTRGLYKERVNLRIEGKLWMATNDKPDIRAGGHGIWRRMLYIPFEVTITEEEKDRELPYKLILEGPGIVAWAVRGCRAWQDSGLQPPELVVDATKAYEDEQDLIADWAAACCVLGPQFSSAASDLYESFTKWVGSEVCSRNMFFKRLAKRPGLERDRSKVIRYWKGVALKASGDTYDTWVTPGDTRGDTKEWLDEALVTPVTGNFYSLHDVSTEKTIEIHDAVHVKSVPSFVSPVTRDENQEQEKATESHSGVVTGKVLGVTKSGPTSTPLGKNTNAWGSCSSCNVTLSAPTGGTGLCPRCLPKPKR